MKSASIDENNKVIAVIPYYSSVFNKMGCMLAKHGVWMIFKPFVKIQHMHKPIKNVTLPMSLPAVGRVESALSYDK